MSKFPARWEMRVIEENDTACRFWKKLLVASWPGKQQVEVFDNKQWTDPVFSVDTLK